MFFYNKTAITPLFPIDKIGELEKKILKIIKNSSELSGKLSNGTKNSFYNIMKNMNGYYSNLIEGNPTHPLDIEKALNGEYFKDDKKREKVEQNTAHIKTQDSIKKKLSEEPNTNITSKEFICWIHKELYENLDEEFRYIEFEGKKIKIIPGKLRNRPVAVGKHIAPAWESLDTFLDFFNEKYSPENLNISQKVIAFAASHHRLVYIHPFLDGNGRVARLFSYAYSIKIGIDADGIWSISRGLARTQKEYYSNLSYADQERQGDLDGRGNLTDKGLYSFCNYFLDTTLDQLYFIDSLLDLKSFENNLRNMLNSKSLSKIHKERAFKILKEIYLKGELERKELYNLFDVKPRTVRDTLSDLNNLKLVVSDTHKSPLKLNFTIEDTISLFPELIPRYLENTIKKEIEKDKEKMFSIVNTEDNFKKYEEIFPNRKTEIIANRELVKQLSLEKQKEIIEAINSILKITQNYNIVMEIIENAIKK